MKKIITGLLAVILSVAFLAINVYAGSFTHTFATRGNTSSQTSKQLMTGKICRLSTNFLSVTIDPHTPQRTVSYKFQYYTPGFLGIYTMVDEYQIYSETEANGQDLQVTYYYNFPEISFVDNSYGENDKAYIKGFATGANASFYFQVSNAHFTFANN